MHEMSHFFVHVVRSKNDLFWIGAGNIFYICYKKYRVQHERESCKLTSMSLIVSFLYLLYNTLFF